MVSKKLQKRLWNSRTHKAPIVARWVKIVFNKYESEGQRHTEGHGND